MSAFMATQYRGAAIGLDHVGIVGADLAVLAQAYSGLGFHLTPPAMHASGRTANRCIMLQDGSYLELMATVPGKSSATLDRFLARGHGAHILALEVADEVAARDRLHNAGMAGEIEVTGRDTDQPGSKLRFALILPADPPEGRMLLIRHLTRDLFWRPDTVVHVNHAVALTEVVYAAQSPAETMTRLSRLSGRPAEPDPAGGYRIPLARGVLRVLPQQVAVALFPGATVTAPLFGLTIAVAAATTTRQTVAAGGVAIRFVSVPA